MADRASENEWVVLLLGGARSGKSRRAESLALGSGRRVVYVATAAAGDAEMQARIAEHRRRRPAGWLTIEESLDLAGVLRNESGPEQLLIVDCLTLWLSNLMAANMDTTGGVDALFAALAAVTGPVVLVSNDVGGGIVPDNALARDFRDLAGALHQRLAGLAGTVEYLHAGLPQSLKKPEHLPPIEEWI